MLNNNETKQLAIVEQKINTWLLYILHKGWNLNFFH